MSWGGEVSYLVRSNVTSADSGASINARSLFLSLSLSLSLCAMRRQSSLFSLLSSSFVWVFFFSFF